MSKAVYGLNELFFEREYLSPIFGKKTDSLDLLLSLRFLKRCSNWLTLSPNWATRTV